MNLEQYYKENKNKIHSSIMEIASDLAVARLINKYKQPFEAFQQPQDPDNPNNGRTCYKEEYQDVFNHFYDEEYDRLAKLMNFDHNTTDGQIPIFIESKATQSGVAYATVRYDIENITGGPLSDEDIDNVLNELWNDTKLVNDFLVTIEICERNDESFI